MTVDPSQPQSLLYHHIFKTCLFYFFIYEKVYSVCFECVHRNLANLFYTLALLPFHYIILLFLILSNNHDICNTN